MSAPDETTPVMRRLRNENDELRAALNRLVDLYRHPYSGRLLIEPGGGGLDDALAAAADALGDVRQRTAGTGPVPHER